MTSEDYYSCYCRSNAQSLSLETSRNLDSLAALLRATENRIYLGEYSDDDELAKLEVLRTILNVSTETLEAVRNIA